MRTLNWYVTKGLLVILIASVCILTFAMVGGNLLKVFQAISQGIPISVAFTFMLYVTPMVFSFTIPWGILIAVLLMFGRMSSNNELTAMRACGISIFQIISPLIILTFVLTVLCLYIQLFASPYYMGKSDALIDTVMTTSPQAIIVPGQATEIGNMMIYVRSRNPDNSINDIQVFTFNSGRTDLLQDITAATGHLAMDQKTGMLNIILDNYSIINYSDSQDGDRIFGKELTLSFNIAQKLIDKPLVQKPDFLTYPELIGRISLYRKLGLSTTPLEVNLNFRMAMGLSPIAFLLLGLPLAIRTSRGETSVGLFLSVILAGLYFFFVIGCKSMDTSTNLYPQLLLWIPNVLYEIGGFYYIFRITRR